MTGYAKFSAKRLEHFAYIPASFAEIYNACNGTKKDISEQKFFDFFNLEF